jgi:uncharacterized protein (TIGR02246 family)
MGEVPPGKEMQMSAKPMKAVLTVGLIALVLGSASLLLAAADGDGAAAMTNLEPGAQRWYTLSHSSSGTVDVRMDVSPAGGATFMIVTPDAVRAWKAGDELVATGRGTKNPYEEADLFWSGDLGQAGDFYLVVEYSGDGSAPSSYSLDVSGADVSSDATTREDPMEADIAAIKEVLNQYAVAVNAGDIDLFASLWAEDGIQMPPGEPAVVGKEQIRQGMAPTMEAMNLDITISSVEEVKVYGDLGLLRCTYTLKATPKAGGPEIAVEPDGKDLCLVARQPDGSWKIAYDCFNSNVAPGQE